MTVCIHCPPDLGCRTCLTYLMSEVERLKNALETIRRMAAAHEDSRIEAEAAEALGLPSPIREE